MLGSRPGIKIGAWVIAALLGLALAALTAGPAQARPGGLERHFGHSGKVLGFDGLYEGVAEGGAAAPDGGAYLAATDFDPTYVPGNELEERTLRLRRYFPDGQLDTSFGNGGTLAFHPPLAPGLTFSFGNLAVDQQGRLLIFGTSYPPAKVEHTMYPSLYQQGPSYATVFRLLPEGSPDPSFGGGDGAVVLDFAAILPPLAGAYRMHASQGTVDQQGRPVFLVPRTESDPDSFHSALLWVTRLLARLTVSGDLDPSFGNGIGVVPLDQIAGARQLALGPGGRIVLGRSTKDRKTMLLALDASGNQVPGFGSNGFRTYRSGLELADLTIDRFGRTVLVGSSWQQNERDGAAQKLARVAADGSLDRSFGKSGRLTVKLPTHSQLKAVAADGKGRILLAGQVVLPGPNTNWRNRARAIGVLRFLPAGKPDRSFGHRGRVLTSFGNGSSSVADELALDGNGHLTVSGLARWPGPTWGQQTQVMVRYDLR